MDIQADASGNTLVEYALVLALLSFVFMAGMLGIETAANATLVNTQTHFYDYGLRNGS